MKRTLFCLLTLATLAPLTASAGSWPVRCEHAASKLELALEHYNDKLKGSEYDPTPMDVGLSVDGKTEKPKSKKRVGGTWVYTFPSATVFYTGVTRSEMERHAVFVKPDGTWVGEVKCQ